MPRASISENVREIEASVVATFLHSQPTGHHAQPSEMLALLAHPGVDAAALEEGLRKWRQLSWFLVDNPDVWQLGISANLTRMHVQAMAQLAESEIDDELRRRIRAVPVLSTADPGVEVHNLPKGPTDVGDDRHLHYLILGPECALEPGRPLPAGVEAYFNEITGPQNPRTYRNNLLALTPEISRLAGLREQVRRWLGWNRIKGGDIFKLLTDLQKRDLPRRQTEADRGLPEAAVAAYNILVAVDELGQVQAQTLRTDSTISGTPFERIKAMLAQDERLLTTTLDPDLILPGSYLEIWREGETAQRVTELMAAFGQFPRLPRLLRPEAFYDTLARGVREGVLVLRLPRADGSARTWWRIPPDDSMLRRPGLEVQPFALAELHNLDTILLSPDHLAEVGLALPVSLSQVQAAFNGASAPRLASPAILTDALRLAVQQGLLMALVAGQAYFRESLPDGILPADLSLLPPPAALHGADLTPQALPAAWSADQTTPRRLSDVLSEQRGYPLPWKLLSEATDSAIGLGLFERDPSSGPWPCSPAAAGQTHFRVVQQIVLTPDMVAAALEYEPGLAPTLRALKERLEEQFTGRAIPEATLLEAVSQTIALGKAALVDYAGSLSSAPNPLAIRVARPAKVLMAEAALSPVEVQQLADSIDRLLTTAPELAFTFRVTLAVEGEAPTADVLAQMNEILNEIRTGWKLG